MRARVVQAGVCLAAFAVAFTIRLAIGIAPESPWGVPVLEYLFILRVTLLMWFVSIVRPVVGECSGRYWVVVYLAWLFSAAWAVLFLCAFLA